MAYGLKACSCHPLTHKRVHARVHALKRLNYTDGIRACFVLTDLQQGALGTGKTTFCLDNMNLPLHWARFHVLLWELG